MLWTIYVYTYIHAYQFKHLHLNLFILVPFCFILIFLLNNLGFINLVLHSSKLSSQFKILWGGIYCIGNTLFIHITHKNSSVEMVWKFFHGVVSVCVHLWCIGVQNFPAKATADISIYLKILFIVFWLFSKMTCLFYHMESMEHTTKNKFSHKRRGRERDNYGRW